MKKRLLAFKLLAVVVLFFTGTTAYQIYSNMKITAENLLRSEEEKAALILETIAPVVALNLDFELEGANGELFQNLVEGNRNIRGVSLAGSDGTVLATRTASAEETALFSAPDLRYIYRSLPVAKGEGKKPIGELSIAYSSENYEKAMADYRRFLRTFTLVALVLSGALLALFIWLLRPLERLAASLAAYDPEDPAFTLESCKGNDEIAVIGAAAKKLVDRSREYTGRLREFNERLEEMVAEKTGELARKNQALEEALEKARNAAQAKSEFLANMSHEIRTPLNAAVGFTQLLREGELDPTQREYLDVVEDSIDNLLSIINDILDFTKIENGMLQLESIGFSPRRELERSIELFAAEAGRKGLHLKHELDPALPSCIQGDPLRLRQIVANLLGNAVKFTPKGGTVTLKAAVSGEGGGGVVDMEFSVSDTGVGIAPEHRELIFQAFSQADSSVTRKFGGTGLGLTISSRLAQLMGGRLDLESEEGKGSRFFFRLSLLRCPEKGEQVGGTSAPAPSNQFRGRVLVAEDVEMNRKMIALLLARRGVEVTLVANGAEAVEAFRADPPEMVLMDINMPEMDGVEATERIIQWEKENGWAHVPIVAFTANALTGDREKYLAAGMDDYMSKPVKREELARILERFLQRA